MTGYATLPADVEGIEVQIKRRLTRAEARQLTELESERMEMQSEVAKLFISQRANSLAEQAAGVVRAHSAGQIDAREPLAGQPEDLGQSPRDVAMEMLGEILDTAALAADDGMTLEQLKGAAAAMDERLAANYLDAIKVVVIPADHGKLLPTISEFGVADLRDIAGELVAGAQASRIQVAIRTSGFPTNGSSGSSILPTTQPFGPPAGLMGTTSIPSNPADLS